jgi:hypothetical protein
MCIFHKYEIVENGICTLTRWGNPYGGIWAIERCKKCGKEKGWVSDGEYKDKRDPLYLRLKNKGNKNGHS